jgi:hypothetical protein
LAIWMNARVAPSEAPTHETYPVARPTANASWMLSAMENPDDGVPSSHASFQTLPFGVHSDIHTRPSVGSGPEARLA